MMYCMTYYMDGGRIVFMNIHFRLYDEYLYFKQLIEHKSIIIKETIGEQGFIVYIKHISNDELIRYFIQIYMMYRLQLNIQKIIRDDYFFTNETEIERIVEWTNWLLQEQSLVDEYFEERTLFNYLLRTLLKHLGHLHTIKLTIDFDTFVLFQFKTFHKQLVHIVGYAIDEMKREEEYQHFVQTARMYVRKQSTKTPCIHIIQDDPFQFYNQFGQKFSHGTLVTQMKQMPLYLFGLDETEWNIAPAMSLLPERLNIYGTEEHEGRTVTLLNIFEERAKFFSIEDFPFAFEPKV